MLFGCLSFMVLRLSHFSWNGARESDSAFLSRVF
jgi:hypothetical protein